MAFVKALSNIIYRENKTSVTHFVSSLPFSLSETVPEVACNPGKVTDEKSFSALKEIRFIITSLLKKPWVVYKTNHYFKVKKVQTCSKSPFALGVKQL